MAANRYSSQPDSLVQRALSRSAMGRGGYATSRRLGLPPGTTVKQLVANNQRQLAQFPGDPNVADPQSVKRLVYQNALLGQRVNQQQLKDQLKPRRVYAPLKPSPPRIQKGRY